MGCGNSKTKDFMELFVKLNSIHDVHLKNMSLKKQPYYDILMKISQNTDLASISFTGIEVSK